MAAMGSSACKKCEASKKKIEELTDERDVFEAQRDHYRDRCDELMNEIKETRQQLNDKFKISEYNTDPSIFNFESLERLQDWQKCLAYCIEEKQEKIETKKSEGESALAEGEELEEDRREELKSNHGRQHYETELPFSPGNLAGFLTRNHQLTQAHTRYPEPRPKKS